MDNIGKLHRWKHDGVQSGTLYRPKRLSLRHLANKHKKSLKFLWLNTYLLPSVKVETPVYEGTVSDEAPEYSLRAYEIGQMIKNSQYDIASLCEVFTKGSRNRLLSKWERTPYWVRGPGEGSVKFKDPILNTTILTIKTQSSGLLTILPGKYGLLSHSSKKFNAKGDRTRDADAWANKGVLKVIVETGFNTKLEIYSTHLIYGGKLYRDISDEERHIVQKQQLDELVNFIKSEKNPSNFIMVSGDFNIHASDPFYEELRFRMEEELSLEDVWTRYAIPRYKAKVGKTNDPSACELDKQPCTKYADDKTAESINEEGRIDYIFIQKPSANHDMFVDISRPRRLMFQRDSSASGYQDIKYLSDHLGIEFQMFISSI